MKFVICMPCLQRARIRGEISKWRGDDNVGRTGWCWGKGCCSWTASLLLFKLQKLKLCAFCMAATGPWKTLNFFFYFSRTRKIPENLVGFWKFWNLMEEVFENHWIPVWLCPWYEKMPELSWCYVVKYRGNRSGKGTGKSLNFLAPKPWPPWPWFWANVSNLKILNSNIAFVQFGPSVTVFIIFGSVYLTVDF